MRKCMTKNFNARGRSIFIHASQVITPSSWRDCFCDDASTHSLAWANVAPGNYTVTAKATDNQGAATVSAPLSINVNAPPTVSLTAPANNASYAAPAGITLAASASEANGMIAKVEFFNGATLLGTATQAPYTFNWANVAPGNYTVTAKATDSLGGTAVSAAIVLNVNGPPAVSLTALMDHATFVAPASITLTATATAGGTGSIAKVEFFNNGAFIGSTTQAPYTLAWPNVPAGSYSITAKATDSLGGSAAGNAVNLTVITNMPPAVSLTATPDHAGAPAAITLTANATDSDGSVRQVDFYNGAALLASVSQAPYTYVWNNVPAGSYSVTAKATDNLGAGTVSNAVAVVVGSAAAQVYAIHSDQLNTPRMVLDPSGNVVWQWGNDDPFGGNVPTASAGFEFNLRFPGQYFDRETNLHYNYFRNYNPATGRYDQFDPLGLRAGINGYGYVMDNPINNVDPLGLKCFTCIATSTSGNGYENGHKTCEYQCGSTTVTGGSNHPAGGDVCYGAVTDTGVSPNGQLYTYATDQRHFDVDTDSLIDKYLRYDSKLIKNLEQASKKK